MKYKGKVIEENDAFYRVKGSFKHYCFLRELKESIDAELALADSVYALTGIVI